MERNEILSKVDHTLLAQTATWAEIRAICDDGMKYHTASVCIPASYVKQAKDYVGGKLAICTVIGFPNGYDTTKAKCFEAADAVENGADEVDMVINIGWVKDRRWDDLLEEIRAVKAACQGKLLKVIIETCLLTDDEKIKMCEIVSDSGADYHQDLHRLLHRRRDVPRCGAVCQACQARREDQGRGRHLVSGRRGEVH